MHRFGERRPFLLFGAPDRHRTRSAVQRPVKVPVVFQLAVVGKDTAPAPACRAKRFPFGVIVRGAAMGHHAHHRRPAAQNAPLRKTDRRRIVLAPPMRFEVGPEISVVVIRSRMGIEHVSGLAAGRRVASGLQQQHACCGSRRKAVGQYAAGRPGPDNDNVERRCHRKISPGADASVIRLNMPASCFSWSGETSHLKRRR